ncbi:unnamed protein product [Didymodactylos carnosus]|uniref:Uncharacterized protein n=1 Tax=Didymodactylos carnosus TaxID=1234261 RepID=A0A813T6G4_9BILA|nr:unnamed protein product [Didymodactylos carnosus]CAF0809570.1 unnamed protein product [Didymodactylos carnosus]CAF3501158.1 unnamed protein product [Didymodactylos carnosus]CAF3595126.1 unnamed protein product [Didymodactylos carnosus]
MRLFRRRQKHKHVEHDEHVEQPIVYKLPNSFFDAVNVARDKNGDERLPLFGSSSSSKGNQWQEKTDFQHHSPRVGSPANLLKTRTRSASRHRDKMQQSPNDFHKILDSPRHFRTGENINGEQLQKIPFRRHRAGPRHAFLHHDSASALGEDPMFSYGNNMPFFPFSPPISAQLMQRQGMFNPIMNFHYDSSRMMNQFQHNPMTFNQFQQNPLIMQGFRFGY